MTPNDCRGGCRDESPIARSRSSAGLDALTGRETVAVPVLTVTALPPKLVPLWLWKVSVGGPRLVRESGDVAVFEWGRPYECDLRSGEEIKVNYITSDFWWTRAARIVAPDRQGHLIYRARLLPFARPKVRTAA